MKSNVYQFCCRTWVGWAKTVFDAEPGPELVEGVPADLASFAGLQKRSVNSFR
jgi:hypothetical protein